LSLDSHERAAPNFVIGLADPIAGAASGPFALFRCRSRGAEGQNVKIEGFASRSKAWFSWRGNDGKVKKPSDGLIPTFEWR